MKGLYKYRGFTIWKLQDQTKWTISANWDSMLDYTEYNTIDEAKNSIDELEGGTATNYAPLPKRWLKSEKLRKIYNG